ncbi:putative zinc-binding metallopeptidase [Salicola sp. Rm-C-2C1-2]|uniref:putative zinc-binding metallopeptidase n=1 Tax=Salicola sp. Rm-C-2C1-2 TaxID=3141321 RepID=UPI0032E4B959
MYGIGRAALNGAFVEAFPEACFCQPGWEPYSESDPQRLIQTAVALTGGVNHVNRSMGLSDIYPFVLSEHGRHKLAYVHNWLRGGTQGL